MGYPNMKTSDAFPSKFLKADDLQGKSVVVTIASYEMENLSDGERKPALYFRGKTKGMILNRTNSNAIEFDCGYGPEMDTWIGKQICVFSAMVDFKGDRVPALRVRPVTKVTREEPPPVTVYEGNEDEEPPF